MILTWLKRIWLRKKLKSIISCNKTNVNAWKAHANFNDIACLKGKHIYTNHYTLVMQETVIVYRNKIMLKTTNKEI